jgi:type II secretory pathway pseudopilin PulG
MDAKMKSLRRGNSGMTLLEVTMAVAILTIVTGALLAIGLSIGDTARVQEIKVITNDEARRALQQIIPELRQAAKNSINWTQLPGQSITYRIATDLDGNGTAVNTMKQIELGAPRTIQRDLNDVNGDGLTDTQLVLLSGGMVIRVLANDLAPENEQLGPGGVFGPAQDLNGNGRLDRGFWVRPRDGGLEISVQAQEVTRRNQSLSTMLTEFVVPRN